MGGILTWVLRKNSGETHVMRRFTNPMPGLIRTPGFLRGEDRAIDDAVQPWLNFKADWEAHQQDGQYEYQSTRYLTPYPAPLAPHDYGIIVTDFVTNTFLSCQGYASLNTMLDMELGYPDAHPEDIQTLAALREANLISHYHIIAPGEALIQCAAAAFPEVHLDGRDRLIFPGTIAYADLKRFCHDNRRMHEKIRKISAVLEVPGLTFTILHEGSSSSEIRSEIEALGFTLERDDVTSFENWDKMLEELA